MTPIGPRCELGECPLWDARTGHLYFIDIDGRAVHRMNGLTHEAETRTLDGRPGSMVLTRDPDQLVVAMEHQLVTLSWANGDVSQLVDVEAEGPGKRLNDGRCDPAGRYWVGSMDDPHDAMAGRGQLHRVSPTGVAGEVEITRHRTGIGVSNGMAFSADGTVMYWADSPRGLVWRYDVDPDTGDRHGERVFLDFSHGLPGAPDGACVDEAGCYWVACVNGGALLRAAPTGDVDMLVDLPVDKPTMPAFGGSSLETIFVTSIADESDGSGTTLMLDVPGVRGLPEPLFGA